MELREPSEVATSAAKVSRGYSINNDHEEESISGYLLKKTREGRWQKRWFETNGVYLTYYKSKRMEKLLAALSLPQVGEIISIEAKDDPGETSSS